MAELVELRFITPEGEDDLTKTTAKQFASRFVDAGWELVEPDGVEEATAPSSGTKKKASKPGQGAE